MSASEGKERELCPAEAAATRARLGNSSGARHSESPACRAPPRFAFISSFDSLVISTPAVAAGVCVLTLDSTAAVPQKAFELAVSSELRPTLMTVSRPPPNLGPPKTAGNA